MGELVAGVGEVPWEDGRGALAAVGAVFDEIAADPALLPALVADLSGDERGGCESYPCMDKLVLWQSADRSTRLRLHLFTPGYVDRPHNHRWSFVSRILRGGYVHSVYGSEDDVLATVREGVPVRPVLAHDEGAGSQYFLDHSLVHSLRADVVTVSLLLRGPSVKASYFTLDPGAVAETEPSGLVLSTGSALEPTDVRASKIMSAERLAAVTALLRDQGLA